MTDFTFAPEIPYHPAQCPNCSWFSEGEDVDGSRCQGFVTSDPFGDLLGTFVGESEDSCTEYVEK